MPGSRSSVPVFSPSENWDDDFEFQQVSTEREAKNSRKRHAEARSDPEARLPASSTIMSLASSQFKEDGNRWRPPPGNWERQQCQNDVLDAYSPPSLTAVMGVLEDKKNIAAPLELKKWAEADPSTPSKKLATENWDNDFEDNSPSGKSTYKSRLTGSTASKLRKPQAQSADEPQESWDDETGVDPPPGRNRKHSQVSPLGARRARRQHLVPTTPTRPQIKPLSSSEDDPEQLDSSYPLSDSDDDDSDYGLAEREEDRTVTARSRRGPLSRRVPSPIFSTAPAINHSPPPPVPSLPPFFIPTSSIQNPQPFPRSPSSSMFSNTIPEYHPYNSTTHLQFSLSRSSGLGNLPPSPPIHKERERKRLRKRSRPPLQGAVGLEPTDFGDEIVDENVPISRNELAHRVRPGQPGSTNGHLVYSPSSVQSASESSVDLHSAPAELGVGSAGVSTPATPSLNSKGALLNRISSVKRWGARRKRDSTVADAEPRSTILRLDTDVSNTEVKHDSEARLTPRPRSSLSSLANTSNRHSQHNSNWFFRVTSAARPPIGADKGSPKGSKSGSLTDLSLRRERDCESRVSASPDLHQNGSSPSNLDSSPLSPTKLSKRKSLGFVQLRRAVGRCDDHAMEASTTSVGDRGRPMSVQAVGNKLVFAAATQPRHVSYGAAEGSGSSDAVGEKMREATEKPSNLRRSFSRSRAKDVSGALSMEAEDKAKVKEKEGGRSFMGSVRRISLVGRHKRTKSGTTMALLGSKPKMPSDSQANNAEPLPVRLSMDAKHPSQGDASTEPHTPPRRPRVLPPPIELQPPSPPQGKPDSATYKLADSDAEKHPPAATSPPMSALSDPVTPSRNVGRTKLESSLSPVERQVKSPASPQSASLGRSTPVAGMNNSPGSGALNGSPVPRRNSLGDLKIPARISQAQVNLKRDLTMVRDFAANIEQLKELQMTYLTLVAEVQIVLDMFARLHAEQLPLSRPSSPSLLNRPKSRQRAYTSPADDRPPSLHAAYRDLAAGFYTINYRYRISWECAELLIELGSGNIEGPSLTPTTSHSDPAVQMGFSYSIMDINGRMPRDRAITLIGEAKSPTLSQSDLSSGIRILNGAASPPHMSWRSSSGRRDLNSRQLALLREMLNRTDTASLESAVDQPSSQTSPKLLQINRAWRWGDAMNSTVTLPSEEESMSGTSMQRSQRSRRLGLTGFRDLLRSLKKGQSEKQVPVPQVSQTSINTDSSVERSKKHLYDHSHAPLYGRKRPTIQTGSDIGQATQTLSPFSPSDALTGRVSPRRPSLASIFRFASKQKASLTSDSLEPMRARDQQLHASVSKGSGQEDSSTGEEEDWDRMDSASDLDTVFKAIGDGVSTVRATQGRSPYPELDPSLIYSASTKRSASGSQVSLGNDSPQGATLLLRSRLSNVEEDADDVRPRPSTRPQRAQTTPSQSAAPYESEPMTKSGSVRSMPPRSTGAMLDRKLSLTPENIKPLLENAREVQARLLDCIAETQALLASSRPPQ